MSQFGIDLFARANPPLQMGYLSDAERACTRVAGLDGTEATNSTVSSFLSSLVATEAGKIVEGANELINKAVPKGTLSWQVEINNPVAVAKEAQIAVDIRTHVLTERAAQIAAGSASALVTSVPGSNPKASNFNALDVVMKHIYAKHPPNVKYIPNEFNIIQDSNDKNKKANKRGKNIKGGFNHPKKFFFEGSTAKGQENGLTYKCRWCPKSVRTPLSTSSNLKTHCDGLKNASRTRKGCPGRAKAIADGAKLPPSAEESVAQTKKEKESGTLTAYIQKGRFDIKTLNKIVLFWMIRQSLPWTCIDDFFLGVAFDYSNATAELYSRTWAAVSAWKLYLNLQSKMLKDIKDSGSKISLVADVWTTKGNHKAFMGISVCYINRDW
ncbi:hypothetical protein PTTG_04041, partial [Puccinia triticina 1-1 BBBD Race 1]